LELLFENWRKFLSEAKNKEGKEQGADGKACWKGYRYAGTKDGKDKCVKIDEEVTASEEDELKDVEKQLTAASGMHKAQAEKIGDIVSEGELEEKVDKENMPCNKPRRTQSHKGKSHVVKACEGGKEKIIPFGEKGASTAGKPKKGESKKMKKKRKSFKARHGKNIAKGKMSAAYWADKVKW
jgi:hypothetical protein